MAARRDCIFAYRLLRFPTEDQKRGFVRTVRRIDKRMFAIKQSLKDHARMYRRLSGGRGLSQAQAAFRQFKRRYR